MKTWKRLLASVASVIGVSAIGNSPLDLGQAYAAKSSVAEAEQACREALEKDTVEALEEFLRKYGDVDTACTALALEALQGGNPGDGGDGGNGYNR